MDSWNNEQKPDVSVSGQFSGNPYQDQTQPQNAYDQNACNQLSPNGTGGYNESRSAADQYGGQPGGYNQTQNMAGGYSGQPNPGALRTTISLPIRDQVLHPQRWRNRWV